MYTSHVLKCYFLSKFLLIDLTELLALHNQCQLAFLYYIHEGYLQCQTDKYITELSMYTQQTFTMSVAL